MDIQVVLQQLKDALGIKGASSVDGLSPHLATVVDVSRLIEAEAVRTERHNTGAASALRYIADDPQFADWWTYALRAYTLFDTQAAVAASNSQIQLYNGVNPGVFDLLVDAATLILPAAGSYELRAHHAALATPGAAAGVGKAQDLAFTVGYHQPAAGTIRKTASAIINGVLIHSFGCVAATDRRIEFKPPYRLTPGAGLNIVDGTVNRAMSVLWEFRERPR